MIRYTEYGWLEDTDTENVDVYAYFRNEVDWTENKDVLSVASTYELKSYKIEITNDKNEVVYTTYLEDGFKVNQLINFLDAIFGVTQRYTNIDD